MPSRPIGHRLRELRLREGLSLRAAARRAGISPAFLSAVELGRKRPSDLVLDRIIAAAGAASEEVGGYDFPPRVPPALHERLAEVPELGAVLEALASGKLSVADAARARENADLVERAVRAARPDRRNRRGVPLWVAVKETFAVGSTRAHDLCRRYGLDPDAESAQ